MHFLSGPPMHFLSGVDRAPAASGERRALVLRTEPCGLGRCGFDRWRKKCVDCGKMVY